MASSRQAQITPRTEVLGGAFEPGFVGEAAEKRYPIRVVRIGEMEIASGRVILVDPFLMSTQDRPLALAVRPGRYPVDLAVADAGESGRRVALARLLLSPAPAVRWAMAVTDEQDVTTLRGDDVFGYGVDAGTGAFVDAAIPAWLETEYPPSDFERYAALQDDWQSRGEAAAESLGIPYGFALIARLGPGDAAMFSSGWGDGHYASWVGYDANDLPVAIVTDFAVITAVNFPSASNR
jgi:hypothetical protein